MLTAQFRRLILWRVPSLDQLSETSILTYITVD